MKTKVKQNQQKQTKSFGRVQKSRGKF